jgi:hypothetical protein
VTVTHDIEVPEPGPNPDLLALKKLREDHEWLVAWTNKQFTAIKNARAIQERQWYLNLAFYFGKQYATLIRSNNSGSSGLGVSTRLYTPPAPYYRARPVINRIRPTIRTELALLTSNRPSATVVPASAEDRDMYAAQAGEQIWNTIYTEHKLKAVLRRALWWTLNCGTSFIKEVWDSATDDFIFHHETPFHVFVPDLREEDIEGQPFLIHAMEKSPEWIQMRFKKALDGSDVEISNSQTQHILDDSFVNLVGTQSLKRQQSVLVLEVWIKPGAVPMFPDGAFYTMVGNKIVQGQQKWPFAHNMYPFAKFDHIPSGKFYATSSTEDLIPLQKEYNRTRGQIIESKNRMSKPQLTAPRGSVDPSKMTSEPGLVVEYTPGMTPPQPLPLQALPNYVLQELDTTLRDWDDISGLHEVSRGDVPPGVTAATAISYLQERDEAKLNHTFESVEEGMEKLAKMTLHNVQQFWTDERTVKVTGPDGSFDAMAFRGSDLHNNVDIRIEGGSSLPVSKAAKQALIMDLMKMNFIDPNKGLEVMDIGGVNKLYEQLQVDKRQAMRENLRMSRVTPDMIMEHQQLAQTALVQAQVADPMAEPPTPPLIVPVNTWDNHKVHIETHNNFRKGQAFENLPDSTKALFEQHVQDHVRAIGIEMLSMNPMAAAGVDPGMIPIDPTGDSGGAAAPVGQEQPGPEPIPDIQTGGM